MRKSRKCGVSTPLGTPVALAAGNTLLTTWEHGWEHGWEHFAAGPSSERPPPVVPYRAAPRLPALDQTGDQAGALDQRVDMEALIERVSASALRPEPVEHRDSEGGDQVPVARTSRRTLG
jgi:hypothetical protein